MDGFLQKELGFPLNQGQRGTLTPNLPPALDPGEPTPTRPGSANRIWHVSADSARLANRLPMRESCEKGEGRGEKEIETVGTISQRA